MKLKTKIGLLILGVILIPFIAGTSLFLLHAKFTGPGVFFSKYVDILRWRVVVLPKHIKTQQWDKLLNERPESVDYIVLHNNTAISSSFKDYPNGYKVTENHIRSLFHKEFYESHYEIMSIEANEKNYLIIMKIPSLFFFDEETGKFLGIRPPIYFGIFMSLIVLVFSSAMTIVIVRSIRRTVNNLEHATKKISEGDLDFQIPIIGSDEFRNLTKSFDKMRISLKEEQERRARFIMGVSHDLKTPLTSIEGYIEAIEDGFAKTPEDLDKYIQIIKSKSGILGSRISDLIEYVKMETGEWKMTLKEKSLKEYCENITKNSEDEITILKRQIKHEINIKNKTNLQMDEDLISRVFENLFSNAVRYSKENSIINFAVYGDSKQNIVISISNQGKGIPKEEIKYIFDPFYRGSNSRREHGFGLGLATVKSIIDAHGWSISVKSNKEGQTEFSIIIPKDKIIN